MLIGVGLEILEVEVWGWYLLWVVCGFGFVELFWLSVNLIVLWCGFGVGGEYGGILCCGWVSGVDCVVECFEGGVLIFECCLWYLLLMDL